MTVYKWSQTAANNANADATINWAEGQARATVNDSSRAEMAAVAKFRDDLSGTAPSNTILETAGTGTAYTLDSNQVLDALTNGFSVTFRCHTTNTGTATIAVDSLAAKPLRWKTAVEMAAGDLVADYEYTATYFQPTDEWLLRAGGTVPLQADQVTGAKIADDSIDSEHYVDGSIDTAHLADDAVTFDKIENIATDTILGRDTAGDGNIEELTLGTGLAISGGALTLTSPPGLVFIEEQTASASAALSFTSIDAYQTILFVLDAVRPDTNDSVLRVQIRPTGGAFQTSGYDGLVFGIISSSSAVGSSTAGIPVTGTAANNGASSTAGYGVHGHVWLTITGTGRKGVSGQSSYRNGVGGLEIATFGGWYDTTGTIDGIRFSFAGAVNITAGTIRAYGLIGA